MGKPCIAMQTDFGVSSGAMFGVCKSVDPGLEVFDVAYNIPKFNIERASSHLRSVVPFWPKGTIFVSVVDPGVGTARRACVAKTANGYYIVTPDNGSLTGVLNEFGIAGCARSMKPSTASGARRRRASSMGAICSPTARPGLPRASSTSRASGRVSGRRDRDVHDTPGFHRGARGARLRDGAHGALRQP